MHTTHTISLRHRPPLVLGRRALVMGILNVTPDSFSDGGQHDHVAAALAHARLMLAEGADILDIGGESTRPGSEPVSVQEELDRIMPVIDAIRADGIVAPMSIDTMKPLVAHQALEAGADIINDVKGLQGAPEMVEIAALFDAPVIAMHWDRSWTAETDPIPAMSVYFESSLAIAAQAGIDASRIILDPGFGFTKTLNQNYSILHHLTDLTHAFPNSAMLVGTSRKSMIGKLLGNQPSERLAGTLATSVQGYERGGHVFRVHEVAPNRDALRVAEATLYGPPQN
ncbi:dihydropteroate synthase [Devosia subaequoris]|uniref:Dihydropteroate synthase n=1 Tax=Devosia subaequoris TaxID=395930 RepID=A0A7W6IR16_9HYPH|nr:dihydropteroate synthase [Devosia subaequoris]MBB4053707.1 dihydropteroate synthase [Devosia subaequoris]MCP1211092.1 dihydropteroate synthase [Devosia subaequoris]